MKSLIKIASFHKDAYLAPLVVTQGGGYFLGKEVGQNHAEVGGEPYSVGLDTVLGAGFLPGGLGYVVGKRHGYREAKEKMNNKPGKKNKGR